jgi:Regulator of chromosome condensation (RCC1) repeat
MLSGSVVRSWRLGPILLLAVACRDQPTESRSIGAELPQLLTVPYAAFTQVSAGNFYTCGLRTDGAVECWGALPLGHPAVKTAAVGSFTQLSVGGFHTCALRTDGAVECWGDNLLGRAPPMRSAAVGRFTLVSAGAEHTCATRDDSTVECWGANGFGEAPAAYTPPARYLGFSAGDNGNCGVLEGILVPAGPVQCWGAEDLTIEGVYRQVAVRPWYVDGEFCALRADGVVECVTFSSTQAPLGVTSRAQKEASTGGFQQVTVGKFVSAQFACALRTDGAVECWGYDGDGEAPALKVAMSGGFSQVSAGGQHACGLRSDGAVECWGLDYYGQAPPVVTIKVMPTATLTADSVVDEGSSFVVALSDGRVPGHDGSPFRYFLDCGPLRAAIEATTRICPAPEGPVEYLVTGVVRDRDGDQGFFNTTVKINNVAPSVAPFAGSEILVTEVFSSIGHFTDPGLDTHTATADYGDGGGPMLIPVTDTAFALEHRYLVPGSFLVGVLVTDDDGGIGSRNAKVTVFSIPQFTEGLVARIASLVTAGALTEREGSSLNGKLDRMLQGFAGGRNVSALQFVHQFLTEVARLIGAGTLTRDEGDPLIAGANRIAAAIQAS